jgi:hypothetical protein
MNKPNYVTQAMLDFLKERYGSPYQATIWDAAAELKSKFYDLDTTQAKNVFNYWQITFHMEDEP